MFVVADNRPLDTIVMDPKLKNYIVEDAKEFFASESWYAERGLPFRRGVSRQCLLFALHLGEVQSLTDKFIHCIVFY